jgi:hypothetical protein
MSPFKPITSSFREGLGSVRIWTVRIPLFSCYAYPQIINQPLPPPLSNRIRQPAALELARLRQEMEELKREKMVLSQEIEELKKKSGQN